MSRPIKFRAWDKYNKKWINRVLAGCNSDGTDYVCNLVWNEEVGDWMHFDEGCGDIVQYTGLKDRNGKEIYEGDIVEELDYSNGAYFPKERQPKKRTVVEYDIGFVYARAAYNLRGRMENGLYNGEVIGNIYETPLEDTP